MKETATIVPSSDVKITKRTMMVVFIEIVEGIVAVLVKRKSSFTGSKFLILVILVLQRQCFISHLIFLIVCFSQ